jgi:hypothetical protein
MAGLQDGAQVLKRVPAGETVREGGDDLVGAQRAPVEDGKCQEQETAQEGRETSSHAGKQGSTAFLEKRSKKLLD